MFSVLAHNTGSSWSSTQFRNLAVASTMMLLTCRSVVALWVGYFVSTAPVGQNRTERWRNLEKGNNYCKSWPLDWIIAMQMVQIKLHNCRKSTIKSNTKLHDRGDIPLCRGISHPAISTHLMGERRIDSAAKYVQSSSVVGCWWSFWNHFTIASKNCLFSIWAAPHQMEVLY